MIPDWETLIPVLVHIQANLEDNVSLQALSKKAGLSPFHFQRLFKAAVGETPKSYTLRLRLERAAFRMILHEGNLLDLAIECGFQNHESFSRAFRRRFSSSPSEYRDWIRRQADSWSEPIKEVLEDPSRRFEISATKVVQMRPMHVAFVRCVGPYESVPDSIFEELERWAARRRLPGPLVWMGIGHDSPTITSRPITLRRGDWSARAIGTGRPHRLSTVTRWLFCADDTCGALRYSPGGIQSHFPQTLYSSRLPGHWAAGDRDLPRRKGEPKISSEPHGYLPAG